MKVVLVIVALVGVVGASHYHQGPSRSTESGSSSQFRNDDNAGGYQFGYDEQHSSGGSFRRESSNGQGAVTGSYGLTDADGRQRIVHYIADAAGFRTQIQTNEPGTEASSPADVVVNRGGQQASAPIAPATKTISTPISLPAPVPLAVPSYAPVQQAPSYASFQQAPIQISSARYSSAPLRATFGAAPVSSYGVKQAPLPVVWPAPTPVVAPLPAIWQAPAPVAAPLPVPLPAQISYQPIRQSYGQQIEQEPLIQEPIANTPRAFSHQSPVAVRAPAYISQTHYAQQQTQDY